jgi:DNA-binding transcriptional LysR family regulator
MDTKWMEDFISLAETQNFRRAAELRHVSQPAFSRRIQSLEAWLGADLIDRSTSRTRLTVAGQLFYERALETLGQLNDMRALLRDKQPAEQAAVHFAVPHTLSLTFMPKWLTGLHQGFGPIYSRLAALNVRDTVQTMADGGCDLLLCYHHPQQPVQLDASRYEMLVLGSEALRAYARCDKFGAPQLQLPGSAAAPLPLLSYTPDAYLGGMVDLILAEARHPLHFEKCYETDMAEGLKMMAMEGHGIAFLPESAVTREVKLKQLARADGGQRGWELNMEIRLYRERPTAQRPGKAVVSDLWAYLVRQKNARLGATLRKCAEKDRGAGLTRPYPVAAAAAGIVSRHTTQQALADL